MGGAWKACSPSICGTLCVHSDADAPWRVPTGGRDVPLRIAHYAL